MKYNIDTPTIAIGDIHGRLDLLELIIDKIVDELANSGIKPRLILLGDYIDRGLKSKEVIDFLSDFDNHPQRENFGDTIFLKGNHERAILYFLEDHKFGQSWCKYGGDTCLASYGVPAMARTNSDEYWLKIKTELTKNLPQNHYSFYKDLRNYFVAGDFLFVHAGVRPGIEIEKQSEEDLTGIRDEFLNHKNPINFMVVHGHTIVSEPVVTRSRIGIDTGAYATGRLSAIYIKSDKYKIIQVNQNNFTID
jgi:serine/threonine protein phosphatase 1